MFKTTVAYVGTKGDVPLVESLDPKLAKTVAKAIVEQYAEAAAAAGDAVLAMLIRQEALKVKQVFEAAGLGLEVSKCNN